MVPPKSPVWQYFVKNSDATATCRLCLKKLKTSGNTTNLTGHIKRLHKNLNNDRNIENTSCNVTIDEAGFCTSTRPSTASSSTGSDIDNLTTTTSTLSSQASTASATTSYMSSPTVVSPVSSNIIRQTTVKESFAFISSFREGSEKSSKIANAILYMICKDMQPFAIVENEGFKNLMETIAPKYKIPSRITLSRLLDEKFKNVSNAYRIKLSQLESLTLTTDIWTDTMQCRSFLGLTAHFSERVELFSCCLEVMQLDERHTGEYLSNQLLDICQKWKINREQITAVVTDSGANILKAVELAFGKKVSIPCFAHTLNLVAEKSIEASTSLTSVISKIKSIVTWFKQSVVAADELRKVTPTESKLIQEVSTRWNSKYFMIQRFLELRQYINDIVYRHASAPTMIPASEIEDLYEVMSLLRPLEAATRELCGELYVTSSKVIPMVHCLCRKISELTPTREMAVELKSNLEKEIKKRFGAIEEVSLLALSTLLDPRFKKLPFQNKVACSKAVKHLQNHVDNIIHIQTAADDDGEPTANPTTPSSSGDEDFNLWSDHLQMVKNSWHLQGKDNSAESTGEIIQYLRSPIRQLHENPLKIWQDMAGAYPMLSKIAPKFLAIVATSVPSERLFSKAGQALTQTRNRLKGKKLSQLLFMNSVDEKYWH